MRTPRIFTGQTLAPDQVVELEPGPGQHVARVLRMGPGDPLVLFDGSGGEFPATLQVVDKKRVTVALGERQDREAESPLWIHLGIAVSRGDRMDWVMQKATELGVSAITPLLTERTEVRLAGERGDKKLRHWRQVTISACEQCGRNRLPLLHQPQDTDQWLQATTADCKLVLHHRAHAASLPGNAPASLALLVGPEGGLSATEIDRAEAAGYQSLSLGPRVLRTETAPLAALAILQARWGDMAQPQQTGSTGLQD
jgi:16S rRNA (uracil1498-N3)-methyltransferase